MKPKHLILKKIRVTELIVAPVQTKGGNDVISWCIDNLAQCCDSNGCWCIYGQSSTGECLIGLEA